MSLLLENNLKTAVVNYLEKGKISKEEFDQITTFDRTPTKKFVFWMVKQYVNSKENTSNGEITLDQLRNIVTEYTTFLSRNLISSDKRDINKFQTFSELESYVNELNSKGVKSNGQLESDFDTVVDNPNLFIAVPYTHEASRKLALKYFQIKKGEGTMNVPWCTAFDNSSHFNSYYSRQFITFYYVLCRGKCAKEIIETLKSPGAGLASKYLMVAIVVQKDKSDRKGDTAYDAMDSEFSKSPNYKTYQEIIKKYY